MIKEKHTDIHELLMSMARFQFKQDEKSTSYNPIISDPIRAFRGTAAINGERSIVQFQMNLANVCGNVMGKMSYNIDHANNRDERIKLIKRYAKWINEFSNSFFSNYSNILTFLKDTVGQGSSITESLKKEFNKTCNIHLTQGFQVIDYEYIRLVNEAHFMALKNIIREIESKAEILEYRITLFPAKDIDDDDKAVYNGTPDQFAETWKQFFDKCHYDIPLTDGKSSYRKHVRNMCLVTKFPGYSDKAIYKAFNENQNKCSEHDKKLLEMYHLDAFDAKNKLL